MNADASGTIVIFPFDLFGSAGTGAGAQLLGDAVREIIDDTEEETRPTRADAFRGKLTVHEQVFETIEQVRGWRKQGRQLARPALADGGFLLWLAGNHLAVIPVLEELGQETLVVQFDAHLDIHDFHDTTAELSHGNFLKHAEQLPRIVNLGHRDLLIPSDEVAEVFEAAYSAEQIAVRPERVVEELRTRASAAKRVWLDLDCDAFDPAFLPAVQHPLPFGLSPPVFLKLLDAVWSDKVAGMSISEFDPGRDMRDASLNLLGWLIEWLLLKRWNASPPAAAGGLLAPK
ncbi:MAG TPA: arginase family protein [Urbifossiella sp.]|nr:arginase family protein [Urbifossiella sp.]